jgi:hypothetical protein
MISMIQNHDEIQVKFRDEVEDSGVGSLGVETADKIMWMLTLSN